MWLSWSCATATSATCSSDHVIIIANGRTSNSLPSGEGEYYNYITIFVFLNTTVSFLDHGCRRYANHAALWSRRHDCTYVGRTILQHLTQPTE